MARPSGDMDQSLHQGQSAVEKSANTSGLAILMFASTYTGINIFHKAFISQEGIGADGFPKGTAKLPGWLRDALEGEFRTWFVPEAGAWHTGTHCVLEMNEDTRCIVSDSFPTS